MAYLLEFAHMPDQDESVYINLDFDTGLTKIDRLGKEECLAADVGNSCQLFNIAGITETAVLTNLVWISKSPAFGWEQILPSVLSLIGAGQELCGSDAQLPDSANRTNLRDNFFEDIPVGQRSPTICCGCCVEVANVFSGDGCITKQDEGGAQFILFPPPPQQ